MNPQISVIVPVYNGERFLHVCIDSILNQSFTDFELILVDDGSKDGSAHICDDYAKKDQRVRVIHKQNEGINATRRRGVREANGMWINFCDNDDSLPQDALENLYCLTENTDIVIGFPDTPNYCRELSLDDCRRNMITARLLPPSPWAKLYRHSLLTDDIFDFPREIDGEEDMIMNIRLMFKITRAPHICFKKVYNFRRNTASVSHTKKASLEHEEIFDKIRAISIPSDVRIKILADVTNPLCGINGATYTFGKQKGLEPAKFQDVDIAIENFYHKVAPEMLKLDGAGAGGGIAAGLCAFAGAEIVSGIQTCLDLINFDEQVADADLVIVGEGRLDSQSLSGKAPIGVAKRTPDGVPVIAICGSLAEDLPPLPFENIIAAFSILEKSEPLEDSLKNAANYLENTATNIGQVLALKKN